MKDVLDFAGEHPVVAVLVVWAICGLLKQPFWIINRILRSRNITRHGWPTAPIDADGDVVHPEKIDTLKLRDTSMAKKQFYDLFSGGRWIGMAEGADEDEARRMAARCIPSLLGRFTLILWHGHLHPDNCHTSGGTKPDPLPEPKPPETAVETQLHALLSHWDEFGPEYGFEEVIERVRAAVTT